MVMSIKKYRLDSRYIVAYVRLTIMITLQKQRLPDGRVLPEWLYTSLFARLEHNAVTIKIYGSSNTADSISFL